MFYNELYSHPVFFTLLTFPRLGAVEDSILHTSQRKIIELMIDIISHFTKKLPFVSLRFTYCLKLLTLSGKGNFVDLIFRETIML